MLEEITRSFLGRGWSFPPAFNAYNREVVMVEEGEDIEQSLRILISTLPGERLMNPTYGCDLHALVFENISPTLENEIITMVEKAIIAHEPRVIVDEIAVQEDDNHIGLIKIQVTYTVVATNTRSNMVYPFYLKEGTNLPLTDYFD